jgi:hypothetical protein
MAPCASITSLIASTRPTPRSGVPRSRGPSSAPRSAEPTRLHRDGDRLGVDGIILSLVLADPDLPNPGRVEHARRVAPSLQLVVHVPAFAACLERDLCRWAVGPDAGRQLREAANVATVDHLPILHFAVRDVAYAQIQPYAAHDEPPLGPQPSGVLCLRARGGVGSFGFRREARHSLRRPPPGARVALETPRDRSRGCSPRDGRRTSRFRLNRHRFIQSTHLGHRKLTHPGFTERPVPIPPRSPFASSGG